MINKILRSNVVTQAAGCGNKDEKLEFKTQEEVEIGEKNEKAKDENKR